jgi:hypothetical protein
MVAMAGLSLTLDPMGKMFQNTSSLKPLGQLKPNNQSILLALAAILNIRLERKTVTL